MAFKLPDLKRSSDAQAPKRRRGTWLFFIAAVIILGFGYAAISKNVSWVGGLPILNKNKKTAVEKTAELPPLTVKVYKVSRVNFRDSLPSLGTTRGFHDFDLKFPISGTVEYVNFREGEKVTQGDIIASLDQKEALLKLEYSKIEYE